MGSTVHTSSLDEVSGVPARLEGLSSFTSILISPLSVGSKVSQPETIAARRAMHATAVIFMMAPGKWTSFHTGPYGERRSSLATTRRQDRRDSRQMADLPLIDLDCSGFWIRQT